MKKDDFAFQFLPTHVGKGSSFLVRKVKVVSLWKTAKKAQVKFFLNGRWCEDFADFSSLASTEEKAVEMMLSRLNEFSDVSTVSNSVGSDSSEKTPATAGTPCPAVV